MMKIWTWMAVVFLAVSGGLLGWAQPPDFLIRPLDIIEITVWRNPDLDTEIEVDPEGYVSLPMLGKVKAAGISTRDLEEELTRLWGRDFIKDPYVRVNLRGQKFFVIGEVNEPGAYEMVGRITTLKAISMAGGFTPYAAKGTIYILRMTEKGTENIEVDFSRIQRGRAEDIEIRPGDVVSVRQSFF